MPWLVSVYGGECGVPEHDHYEIVTPNWDASDEEWRWETTTLGVEW